MYGGHLEEWHISSVQLSDTTIVGGGWELHQKAA